MGFVEGSWSQISSRLRSFENEKHPLRIDEMVYTPMACIRTIGIWARYQGSRPRVSQRSGGKLSEDRPGLCRASVRRGSGPFTGLEHLVTAWGVEQPNSLSFDLCTVSIRKPVSRQLTTYPGISEPDSAKVYPECLSCSSDYTSITRVVHFPFWDTPEIRPKSLHQQKFVDDTVIAAQIADNPFPKLKSHQRVESSRSIPCCGSHIG